MNDDLIIKNMPLVYYIVQHDYPKYVKDNDVIQSGMLGLVRSAKNFDPSKGYFSSYARKYIHGEIKRELKRRENDKMTTSLEQFKEGGGDIW